MTWVASGSYGGGTYIRTVAIRAGSYAIKISKIEIIGEGQPFPSGASDTGNYYMYHYIASTISGANSLTLQPLREGASPASATVRYSTAAMFTSGSNWSPGTAVSISGTALPVGYEQVGVNQVSTYQPTNDILIAPGSVFAIVPFDYVVGSGNNYTIFNSVVVTIEEYHLARST